MPACTPNIHPRRQCQPEMVYTATDLMPLKSLFMVMRPCEALGSLWLGLASNQCRLKDACRMPWRLQRPEQGLLRENACVFPTEA